MLESEYQSKDMSQNGLLMSISILSHSHVLIKKKWFISSKNVIIILNPPKSQFCDCLNFSTHRDPSSLSDHIVTGGCVESMGQLYKKVLSCSPQGF